MSEEYKSFEELREKAQKKYESFDMIEFRYLNDLGKLVYEVYDIIDDCFRLSKNLHDLVELVSKEIKDLVTPSKYTGTVREGNPEIAEKLRRYIRWNIERDFWEKYPEYAPQV